MGTKDRKPRINKKPTKGMKMFLKQGRRAITNAIAAASKGFHGNQWWHTPRAMRAMWLQSHTRSRYTPHQNAGETLRRRKQMKERKCIHPTAWL